MEGFVFVPFLTGSSSVDQVIVQVKGSRRSQWFDSSDLTHEAELRFLTFFIGSETVTSVWTLHRPGTDWLFVYNPHLMPSSALAPVT